MSLSTSHVWNPDVEDLNSFMSLDTPVHVDASGTVIQVTDHDLIPSFDDVAEYFGHDLTQRYHHWYLLRGFSNQYGYAGPLLHPSEFIGGGLERHILAHPGLYVALPVHELLDDSDDDVIESESWVIAHRPQTSLRNHKGRLP